MSIFDTYKVNINLDKSTNLFPARVTNISTNNNSDIFQNNGGWVGIGNIEFFPLYTSTDVNNPTKLYAKPLFSNISQLPLKNEIVLILSGPSYKMNEDQNNQEFYYLNIPIGLWNNSHHNSFPDPNNNQNDINFGDTFQEKDNIKKLLPEEGDVIFEGRFGQSIRFSSTTKNKKNNSNFWSSSGENGDPIILIRNNPKNEDGIPWNPTMEDINEDGSSIIVSSTQEIPLQLGCNNLKSFNISISSPFNSSLKLPTSKF